MVSNKKLQGIEITALFTGFKTCLLSGLSSSRCVRACVSEHRILKRCRLSQNKAINNYGIQLQNKLQEERIEFTTNSPKLGVPKHTVNWLMKFVNN